MHLSLLSGSDLSDLLDDSARVACSVGGDSSRQHFDAVVRGCLFVVALLTPFAITFAPVAFGPSQPLIGVAAGSPPAR